MQNNKFPQVKWHSLCSNKIFNDKDLPQIFYNINNLFYCFACRYYCNPNLSYDELLDNKNTSVTCQCNEQCLFKKCINIENENIINSNKNSIRAFQEEVHFKYGTKAKDLKDRHFGFNQR